MTKTTAEVKRWDANGPMDLEPEGSYVLATDYDTLQQRCRELTECVRELVNDGDCIADVLGHIDVESLQQLEWNSTRAKALALIGGEKGVGT